MGPNDSKRIKWNLHTDESEWQRLREEAPAFVRKHYACSVCAERGIPLCSRAQPLFHDSANWNSNLVFLMETPNETDIRKYQRMSVDRWNPDEKRGRREDGRCSDWTGEFFSELLWAQFGLFQHQVILANAVLCPPAQGKPRAPHRIACGEEVVADILKNLAPSVVIAIGGLAWEQLNHIFPMRSPRKASGFLRDSIAKPHRYAHGLAFVTYHTSRLGQNPRTAAPQFEHHRIWAAMRAAIHAEGLIVDTPLRPMAKALPNDDGACESIGDLANEAIRQDISRYGNFLH